MKDDLSISTQESLNLDEPLNSSQYVGDIRWSEESKKDAEKYIAVLREQDRVRHEAQQDKDRASLVRTYVWIFAGTLAVSAGLTSLGAFHPNADKEFIQNWTHTTLTIHVGVMGTFLGYFFGTQKK